MSYKIDFKSDHHEEDYNHFTWCYSRENYNMFAGFLRCTQNNIRLQAEFLNYMTDGWGLRIVYPELPIMMFEGFKRLSYKDFDDLSQVEKEKVRKFFATESSSQGLKRDEVTEDQLRDLRACIARMNAMPTL